MKKKNHLYRRLLASRILPAAVSIILQICWFAISILRLSEYSIWFEAAFKILSLVMVIYIVCKEDNPSYKIGWIIFILTVPIFGGLLYFFAGNKKPTKSLHNRISASHNRLICQLDNDGGTLAKFKEEDSRRAAVFSYVSNMSGYPVYSCDDVKYYPIGEELYADMLAEMEKAERYIYMEYFIISKGKMWDGVLDVLKRKAEQGVEIRIIYDDMGCVALLPSKYYKELEKLHPNIKCLAFNPVIPVFSLVMNNRSHRKILVIDGHTAFSGGVNISDEYINVTHPHGHWKDTGIRVRGKGAMSFCEMFLELWETFRHDDEEKPLSYYAAPEYADVIRSDNSCGGVVQPFYDTPLDREALSENLYIEILNSAEKYVYIYTPYLILDDNMKTALCLAAKRGVDVRVVTPGIPDKKAIYRLTRANYMPLLQAGVRIYEYTPGFIHAKSFVSDDKLGIVGTINLDYRSLFLHFECGMLFYGCKAVDDMRRDCEELFEQSRQITTGNIRQYYKGTMFDAVLRILAPLL